MPTLSTPFDEILKQFQNLLRQQVSKQANRLPAPTEVLKAILSQFTFKRNLVYEEIEKGYDNARRLCLDALRGPHVRIEVSNRLIRSARGKPIPVKGTIKFTPPGRIFEREVDCFLSCGHWANLDDVQDANINIIDHLDKLLPKHPRLRGPQIPIGLVTYQNGIMNNLDHFAGMSTLIVDQFQEGPLCIGLHNATSYNPLWDMRRFQDEPKLNENSVYSLCQMMKTFADLLPAINPHMVWAHFAHSEGALIANTVLSLCDQWWLKKMQSYLKEHLVVATYGAVKPVPIDSVLDAINTYSKKDIALFYGSAYLDKDLNQITEESYTSIKVIKGKTYKVTIIDSQLPIDPLPKIKFEMPEILTLEQRLNMSWLQWLVHIQNSSDSPRIATLVNSKVADIVNSTVVETIETKAHAIKDHGFGEATYKSALIQNIRDFRRNYKIHDSKSKP